MRVAASLLLCSTLLAPVLAAAGPIEDFAACLQDNTTGKDRKDLARWVFVSMSVHPAIQADFNVSEATRLAAHQRTAALMTRLVTENCPVQARAAGAGPNGAEAFGQAFKLLGEVAMHELMEDRAVKTSLQGLMQHFDMKKFEPIFRR